MITTAYSDFFAGLEKDNSKAWFDEHRKNYENDVKKPFLALLSKVIPELSKYEAQISPNPKDALFRINKDIRFSADKTPYNTLMKAGFSPGGKKSFLPGYYLGIGSDTIHMGGGLFNIKAQEVKAVRDLILDETKMFTSIVHGKSFTNMFGQLAGDVAKRINKEHQAVLDTCPEIAHKQFYAMCKVPLKPWLGKDGLDVEIMKYFKEISALNQFLNKAF